MRSEWLLALCVLALAPVTGCRPKPPTSSDSEPTEAAWFEDVTASVGLAFVHDAGPANPAYFMPRGIGSGGAVLDFDGDGRLDLYLIHNGGPNGLKNRLFQQEKDGRFRDASIESGLDVAGWGQGVAVGDVNNDGRPDVLLTEYGRTRLFLNLGGGKFRDISRESGIDNPQWGTSAAFFDFDRDGRLDLIVANYVDYDPSIKCSTANRAEFCGPNAFNGTASRLFHNLGPKPGLDVVFEDVTIKAGLGTNQGKGLGVLCADLDGDGWPDIFIANDVTANFAWINKHDGTFKDEAVSRGLAYVGTGQTAANMGVAWADADGDGLMDLFVTHLITETHTLWRQSPRGVYQDRTVGVGLTRGRRSTGFGTAFVDFDRDGAPDLAWVNGGIARDRSAEPGASFWQAYAQQHQLFANDGRGQFRDISAINPAFCGQPAVGRGLMVADLDNDGAPDLVVTETAGAARVLRNVAPATGNWLAVRALLAPSGRDAYGAEIIVKTDRREFRRLVQPGYSYCTSSDPRAHFGLHRVERYESLRVVWPDGTIESFPGGPVNREVVLRQAEGRPTK